jgi:hypothetical protein
MLNLYMLSVDVVIACIILETIIGDDCIVVESYVHAFMTDGDGFYIHIGDDYDVFVAS